MKNLVWILIFLSSLSFSQNERSISFIDRDSTNKALFDYDNPISLVSLIKFNILQNPMGILNINTERVNPDKLYSYESHDPFPQVIASIEYPGEDSIDWEGNTVYYPNKKYYYDVDGISRIIIIRDKLTHEITGEEYYGIDEICFAKQFKENDKYDVVLKLNFSEFIKMDAFKLIQKVPEYKDSTGLKAHMLDYENQYSLINFLKTTCTNAYQQYLSDSTDIYPKSVSLLHSTYPLNWWNALRWPDKNLFFKNEETSESQIFGLEHAYKNWPWDSELIYEYEPKENKESILNQLKNAKEINIYGPYEYVIESIEYPGEDSIDFNGDYVYEEKFKLFWADFQIKNIYAIWDFHFEPYETLFSSLDYRSIRLEKLIFTTELKGFNKEVAAISLDIKKMEEDLGLGYDNLNYWVYIMRIMKNDYFYDYSKLPWRAELFKQLNEQQSLSLKNKNDLIKIQKEFYMDYSFDDKGNIFNSIEE